MPTPNGPMKAVIDEIQCQYSGYEHTKVTIRKSMQGEHLPHEQEHWNSEEREHHLNERLYWARSFRLTVATTVAAIAAAIFAGFALMASWGSLQESRRQATAAEDQVAVAKDTEQRQLRAYLIVRATKIDNFFQGGKAQVDGTFENLGQTPVYEATWFTGINVFEYPKARELQNKSCDEIMSLDENNRWFFGKQAGPLKDRDETFSENEISSIQNGSAAIYFHGRVCYQDIFKIVRKTDFCIFWRWENGSLSPATYCTNGNIAD